MVTHERHRTNPQPGLYFALSALMGGVGVIALYEGISASPEGLLNISTISGALGLVTGAFFLRFALIQKRA